MSNRRLFSRGPDYFAKLYAKNPDPWNFEFSIYEQNKYQETLEALEGRYYNQILEVGCSIGILTKMLAEHCNSMLAVDIIDSLLASAAKRCVGFSHVTFKNLNIPREWPAMQKFDLILLSEVLYFLTPEDISKLSCLASNSALPGAAILLVNYTGEINEPCSGNEAAEIFIRSVASTFIHVRHLRRKKFRIDLLKRLNN